MNYRGPATADLPNGQPIEKLQREYDGTLQVHSIFYTIQGEGPFSGVPAVFVRLAGCNLQCPWCDTEYTAQRRKMTSFEILEEVRKHLQPGGLVVITGGEPFRQQLADLLTYLIAGRYYVQIESNGTLPPPAGASLLWSVDPYQRRGAYLVCSPKTGKVNPAIWEIACCVKYVGSKNDLAEDDGLPVTTLGHSANPRLARPPLGWKRPIYLQPADHKDEWINKRNIQAVAASCLKHGYTVQIQIHKILELE